MTKRSHYDHQDHHIDRAQPDTGFRPFSPEESGSEEGRRRNDEFYSRRPAQDFYEQFLGMKVTGRNKDRWASFENDEISLGLFNPAFDREFIQTDPNYMEYMDDNFKSFLLREPYNIGNNTILTFRTEDIIEEHQRIKQIDPNPLSVTEIMLVNFVIPYWFFQFVDPEGNTIEVFSLNEPSF